MTLKETIDSITEQLYGAVTSSKREAQMMAQMIMESLKGYSTTDLIVKADQPQSDYIAQKVKEYVGRLLKHEPIQYVLGKTMFYGLTLKVTPDVLIPRQETTELVDIIVDENSKREDLRVADICTGSGCIALALSRNLPFSKVTAIDLSAAALEVARQNAATLKCRINFEQADALNLGEATGPLYDIIVSNPPYVLESERAGMEANVLSYEPEMALFVPDNDPLKFYAAISHYALSALCPGGRLYFEINPLEADRLAKQLAGEGWEQVELHRDISGRNRFLSATHIH